MIVIGLVLGVWGLQRIVTLLAAMRLVPKRGLPARTAPICRVTVQVPLYNEPRVCERAVDAACSLRWPDLEVQILDDSDDDTTRLVAAAVVRWRALGVDVTHVRREGRAGFKAGALAHGLTLARGEHIAIFDADFVPAPDFLERTVPLLAEHDVVQARWDHLNRGQSLWTRGQAALLDAHFAVEQEGRSRRGRFFGFNGTAGVWRRSTITAAGGWSASTLTEDLDLSVRAFVGGARFVYVDDVGAPAELPADVDAWRVQQHRWAKGAMQTARARLPMVWRSQLGLVDKIDVTLKLLQNVCWPLLAIVVVALPFAALTGEGIVGIGLGTVPALAVVAWAAHRRGTAAIDSILALGVAAALSLHVARASLAGLLDIGDRTFHRTPKAGTRGRHHSGALEAVVGAAHLTAAIVLCARGDVVSTPMLWLCGVALFALAMRRHA